MHIPTVFAEDNFDNIIEFIVLHPLVTLIPQTKNGIEACHVPLFWYNDHAISDFDFDVGVGVGSDVASNKSHSYLYGHFGRN